jgi:hypothetical protein
VRRGADADQRPIIRYAVVGLGHIAQAGVPGSGMPDAIPLVAFVSDDPE